MNQSLINCKKLDEECQNLKKANSSLAKSLEESKSLTEELKTQNDQFKQEINRIRKQLNNENKYETSEKNILNYDIESLSKTKLFNLTETLEKKIEELFQIKEQIKHAVTNE